MNKKELIALIEKYQKGNCSPKEQKLIENYLNSFQNGNTDWDESDLGKKDFVEEKLFKKIEKQITDSSKKKTYSFIKPNYIFRAAASLAFIFILSFVAYYFLFTEKQHNIAEIKWNEKRTKIGEKSIITFLDGTKITLNADSKLKYSVSTESRLREFYLEGEAYFEVAQNKEKPFIVHSGSVSTLVLGTKFDVKAFPKEMHIVVSLVEGSIKVKAKNNAEQVLSPKQQLTYNLNSDSQNIKSFEVMQVIGWRDNILIFDNLALEDALILIERAYGVNFELTDDSIKKIKITANFENESIWTIVKVIKKSFGLEYMTTMENDRIQKIVFYKK